MIESPLQRIAAGDADAIRDCINDYGALVWGVARRLSRTPSDAEDAVQEIFLEVWKNASRFDPSKGSDKIFIMMIARRRLIDRIRKVTREPPMDSLEVLDDGRVSLADACVTSSLEDENLVHLFAALRRGHREVLKLSLIGGFSQSEIATHLEMPLGTVKSFMRRGLMRLRELSMAHYSAAIPLVPQSSLPVDSKRCLVDQR